MKWRPYLLTTGAILLLRITDLFLTWIYTLDLAHEWNPIIAILGISWPGFILTQVVISLFAILNNLLLITAVDGYIRFVASHHRFTRLLHLGRTRLRPFIFCHRIFTLQEKPIGPLILPCVPCVSRVPR